MFKQAVLISSLGAALALTGCSTMHSQANGRSEGQVINDDRITSILKADLADQPVYKYNQVDVKTYDGIVQLSGFVNNDGQKQEAQRLAQQVPGVRRVENAITVVPAPAPTGRYNYQPGEPNQNQNQGYPANQNNQPPQRGQSQP